jgi:hypothetical protein
MKILNTLTVSGATTLASASATSLTLGTDLAIAEGGTGQSTAYAALDALSIHGADIASAGTINLTTATGHLVDVTGTTTITAITLAEGAQRIVRFTGALTLTHGGSLVLPGGVNITTVAGDMAIFVGYAGGVVRCVSYSPITVTGTGAAVRANSPALVTPTIDGNAVISTVITGAAQGDIIARTATGFVNTNIGTSQVAGRGASGEVVGLTLGTNLTLNGTTITAGSGGATVDASWNFDTSTASADPGNKDFRLNNATLASVTAIYINDTTNLGFDIGTLAGFLVSGHRIFVQQKDDVTKVAIFQVSGVATDNTGWWTIPVTVVSSGTLYGSTKDCVFLFDLSVGGAGVSDGDKGDITVSASGATWTIDAAAVSLSKMANLAQDQFIGRVTASTGVPETATITSVARTVLDDTTTDSMLQTLAGGSAHTGSTGLVRATSPTLVTPILGVASATSLATSAATPLLLTNGQLVNVALTSQTSGATTLTIPDFAGVVDEFTFKTKSQTLSNKTFVAPILGAASATSLTLTSDLALADGGTGQSTAYAAFDALTIHAADVASAGTLDLDSVQGVMVDVTGTTGITAITLTEGRIKICRFTGVLTITHGINLNLPGSTSITTAAGDVLIFAKVAASIVKCVAFMPGSMTGTGATVRATSPTFVTPVLGTPSSGTLSSCTGYPATALSGTVPQSSLGTGSGGAGTKVLYDDQTYKTLSGGGDAVVAGTLDQFADVTQTAGQTLAITSSTTLSGGTHSGSNTGDQTITLSGDISGTGTSGITTAIGSKKVTIGMLADGTDGELITWNSSGVAATVAVGTATHVLTSNGAGAAPTFQAPTGGGLANVVEDTTPQLGGQLDVNGNALGDGTLELITFTETASAVNQINITNAATGTGPSIDAVGDDTNIDLNLDSKGTGLVKINGNIVPLYGQIIALQMGLALN